MSPCLYGNCLAPSHCKDGAQECHINAHGDAACKADLLRSATGQGIGRNYERVCIGASGINEVPRYEQVEK